MRSAPRQSGFALIITLALLALLVLAVVALSALVKVGGQVSSAGTYQVQARQNAMVGLNVAISELQRYAGADGVLTGMAGATMVPSGAGNPARHWCGVWNGTSGALVTWVASGAVGSAIPTLSGGNAIELVSTASVGADATDREHIKVLRMPIVSIDRAGLSITEGNYAYWVGDEGAKLSLVTSDADTVVTGLKHAVNQQFTGITPGSTLLNSLVSFEQVNFAGATTAQRQGGFHTYGRTHRGINGGALRAGMLNVNTSSARYWTGVGATFTRWNPAAGSTLNATSFGNAVATVAGRPFKTADDFLTAIISILTSRGIAHAQFNGTMRPWLVVRSDTFRIRAYGEALNPADPTRIESAAYCEAIVQRTLDTAPNGLGNRFVITYFRWLGPDDI